MCSSIRHIKVNHLAQNMFLLNTLIFLCSAAIISYHTMESAIRDLSDETNRVNHDL